MPMVETEAVRAPDRAVTLEGAREAHHARRTNADDSQATPGVEASPAPRAQVNTREAEHTVAAVTGAEVEIAAPAIAAVRVEPPVDGTTVPGGNARTADLGLPHAHLTVTAGSFMTARIVLPRLRHHSSHQTSPQFPRQGISLFLHLPQLDTKAPGHRLHRLHLRTWPEAPRDGSQILS